jgi:hypothetical protein
MKTTNLILIIAFGVSVLFMPPLIQAKANLNGNTPGNGTIAISEGNTIMYPVSDFAITNILVGNNNISQDGTYSLLNLPAEEQTLINSKQFYRGKPPTLPVKPCFKLHNWWLLKHGCKFSKFRFFWRFRTH